MLEDRVDPNACAADLVPEDALPLLPERKLAPFPSTYAFAIGPTTVLLPFAPARHGLLDTVLKPQLAICMLAIAKAGLEADFLLVHRSGCNIGGGDHDMTLRTRIKTAMRVLARGEARSRRRTLIPAISREDLADFHRFFPRSKFFILGHARSGTTLLMRLVRLHGEVHCDYQAHFFTRRPLLRSLVDSPEAEEWLSRKSNRWNHGKDLSPIVLRSVAEYIMERDAARFGKRIVGDKSPTSSIHGQAVRDLHALFPDAKLIYIVRDGRDVAISERFRNFVEDSRFLNRKDRRILETLRENPESFVDGRRSLFTEEMLRRIARGWATDVAEIDSEARRLFGRKYLALHYEGLVEEPGRTLERVWRFLGTQSIPGTLAARVSSEMKSNPDEEWQYRRGEDLAAFLVKGKSGNWHSMFTERDRQIFKEVAGEMLLRWNYERSNDW